MVLILVPVIHIQSTLKNVKRTKKDLGVVEKISHEMIQELLRKKRKAERTKIPTVRKKNKANGETAMWCSLPELYV